MRLPKQSKGRNHSMPRNVVPFVDGLERLAGVEAVGIGRFNQKSIGDGLEFECRVKYWDETKRTLKVSVAYGGSYADFFVRVNPARRTEVENYVNGYNKL